MTRIIIALITLSALASCTMRDPGHTNKKDAFSAYHILDSAQAAQVIVRDTMDYFFDKITPIDMGIQLHTSIKGKSRAALLKAYKKGLQKEVTDFSKEEHAFLMSVMVQALQMCSQINRKIIPNQINLIKVKGDNYGDGVFYTREKSIIIPANELEGLNAKKILPVMVHELSHIMTRYHPVLKDSLYACIGFHRIPYQSPWAKQDSITDRFLTNPDGVSRDYSISVHTRSGEKMEALPIIRSNFPDFSPENPSFFAYLGFQIFPIIEKDKQLAFAVKADGNPIYAINEFTDFFTQIKDNTDYIIHPDEIIADNFMILLMTHAQREGFDIQQYSAEGRALLDRISRIIGVYTPKK